MKVPDVGVLRVGEWRVEAFSRKVSRPRTVLACLQSYVLP